MPQTPGLDKVITFDVQYLVLSEYMIYLEANLKCFQSFSPTLTSHSQSLHRKSRVRPWTALPETGSRCKRRLPIPSGNMSPEG